MTRDIDILPLMPPSISGDEALREIAESLTGEHTAFDPETPNLWQTVELLAEASPLTDELLALLALWYRADKYDPTAAIEDRRDVVLDALKWRQRVGRPGAIVELLAAFGYTAYVYEGGYPGYHFSTVNRFDHIRADHAALDQFTTPLRWDPSLLPYQFGVFVEGSESASDLDMIRALIALAQNVRSHLAYLNFELP